MRWVITINTYWAVWSPTLSQGAHLQKPKIFVGAAGGKVRVRARGAAAPLPPAGYAHATKENQPQVYTRIKDKLRPINMNNVQ